MIPLKNLFHKMPNGSRGTVSELEIKLFDATSALTEAQAIANETYLDGDDVAAASAQGITPASAIGPQAGPSPVASSPRSNGTQANCIRASASS